MDETPVLTLSGVVLDSPDARGLAAFYRRLLGWAVQVDEPDWVRLRSPAGGHAVAAGAVLADYQPQDDVRVYLDPAGHPFCLALPD
jgi:hypothetical protein